MIVHVQGHPPINTTELSAKRLTRIIRINATKKIGPTIEEIEKPFSVRRCSFCARECRRYIFRFDPDFSCITGLDYADELYYCRQKGCAGKKLNPNSVEFVRVSRNMSHDDALKFIKSRNKSPFYAENHATPESYKAFQGVLSRMSVDRRKEIIDKQNYSRSIEAAIEKWGETEGPKKWAFTQSLKAITLDNMIRVHGEIIGPIKYNKWRAEISCTLDNFIRRDGEEKGLEKYHSWLDKVTRTCGGYGIKTKMDGIHFYSLFELSFYKALKKIDFDYPFEHDRRYPGSFWRSDFYFPLIDRHLEIAGMMSDEKYKNKIEEKIKLFNPFIVQTRDECVIMAQHIKDLHDSL